jgi:hypothetical protein
MWWLPFAINAGKNLINGEPQTKGLIESAALSMTGNLLGNTVPGAEVSGVGGSTGGVAGVGNVPNAAGAGGGISSATSNIIPGSLESEGLLKTIGDGSTLYNQDYFANVLGNPVYTGGEGLLSNVAGDIGASLGNISPQNLYGVASLLGDQQDTSQYRQMAGTGGGVSRGSGQGLALQMPQAKVFKRRKA